MTGRAFDGGGDEPGREGCNVTAILVLGASGRTGAHVVGCALSRGHNVVALLRNPSRIAERVGLTVVEGTPANVDDLAAAIQGTDAVISALGNVRTSDMPWSRQVSPPQFMTGAMRNAVVAMKLAAVQRIVIVSALGVGDSLAAAPAYYRFTVQHTNLATTFADHNVVDREIRQADVDWTLLRPVLLTNSAKKKPVQVRYVPDKPAHMRISRREVAGFAVDALNDHGLIGRDPILSR
jgi:putative NADH-flavin reductase